MSPTTRKQLLFAAGTFLIYAGLLGWQAAVLLVCGVGFHEYSHLWAARRMGLKTGGFYLVPFVGGVALIEGSYKTRAQQAFVVLAGPVGGGLLALLTAAAYFLTGNPFLLIGATWMAWLNLFNLLPLSFMDGGQLMGTVTYSINKTFGVVCYVVSSLLACFVLWFFNPILAIIVGLISGRGAMSEINNWRHYRSGETWKCTDNYLNAPKKLTKGQMAFTILGWAATAATLFVVQHLLKNIPGSDLVNILHSR